MTVRNLLELLFKLPLDMEVVETRYSDFGPMDIENWVEANAVWQVKANPLVRDNSPWLREVHNDELIKMSEEDQSKVIRVLHFRGN